MYQWIPRKVPYFPDCILPIVKDVRLSSLLHFSSYVNVFPRKAPCFPECWLPFVKDVKDVFWLDLVMYKVSQESPILSWMLVINVKDVFCKTWLCSMFPQESPILSWMLVTNVKDVYWNLVILWNVLSYSLLLLSKSLLS